MDCAYCCALTYAIGLFVIYKLLDRILRIPRIGRYADRCIFVTGCDTGFGHELVKRLDSLGCHVFAGCLTEKGETELKKTCSDRLQTLSLDVTKQESVRKAFQVVSEKLAGKALWGVVNNAGIGCPVGPPEWTSIDDFRRTCDVNLFGAIDVSLTFLPLIKKSRGRLVNMSSVAGRISTFGISTYSVSKYGVEAFTDAIRRSLRPFGVKAILMEPFYFKTPLTDSASFRHYIERGWKGASQQVKEEYGEEYYQHLMTELPKAIDQVLSDRLDFVVDAYEHALFGCYPRARYPVGGAAMAMHLLLLIQALPEWIGDWIIDRLDTFRILPAAAKNK